MWKLGQAVKMKSGWTIAGAVSLLQVPEGGNEGVWNNHCCSVPLEFITAVPKKNNPDAGNKCDPGRAR
jgi:hypothetical protein